MTCWQPLYRRLTVTSHAHRTGLYWRTTLIGAFFCLAILRFVEKVHGKLYKLPWPRKFFSCKTDIPSLDTISLCNFGIRS